MKFIITIISIVFIINIYSIPASPHFGDYTQNDGSTVLLKLFGDEKVKWAETEDGYSLMHDGKGNYVYALKNENNEMLPSKYIARNINQRTNEEINFLNNTSKHLRYNADQISLMKSIWAVQKNEADRDFPTTGTRRLIMILVGFTDRAFSKSNAEFSALMNNTGYSVNGAYGSVNDWFKSNSFNQLNLITDVAGPYTLSSNMAYYGANSGGTPGNDIRPRQMVTEAINLADPSVNFSIYDNDGDTYVDGLYIIYAGYGEENSGVTSNAIWAHAWSLSSYVLKDAVKLQDYSCSSELLGASGSTITSIGVICHEFSHVCGLLDYYDTDYDDSVTGGQSFDLGEWDPMAGGSWNDNGRRPPHHNCYSKSALGWQTPTVLSSGVSLSIPNAHNYNVSYKYTTTVNNEYFMFENRQQIGWDTYLPYHGLLIFHVDKNYSGWSNNKINVTPDRQGMDIEEADNIKTEATITGDPFPGTSSKRSFTDTTTPNSKNWSGGLTNKPITNIYESNDVITLDFMGGSQTLPVTLSAFDAINTSSQTVSLMWTTHSESNIFGYHIYRNNLADLNSSIRVSNSIIEARNTSTEQDYEFTDAETENSTEYYYWLQSNEMNGNQNFFGPVYIKTDDQIQNPIIVPKKTVLNNAYPNPFNPNTTISFDLAEAKIVQIDIFNAKGQFVKNICDQSFEAGQHQIYWDGKDKSGLNCSSGIYYYIMRSGRFIQSKKMLLLK